MSGKKGFWGSVILSIILIALAYVLISSNKHQNKPSKSRKNSASTVVDVATVESQDWRPTVTAVGQLVANQGITIKSQVAAPLKSIYFTSGQEVKKGDLLAEFVNQSEEGDYNSAKATYDLSLLTYQRNKKLLAFKAVSQDDVDTALATAKADKGAYQTALGEYNKTRVQAPFSGVLGLKNIHTGQYLSVGDDLVELQDIDSLYVDFILPEKYLSLIAIGSEVTLTPDTLKVQSFTGKITALQSTIDTDTGSISVRAQVDNTSHQFLPGTFVTVLVPLGDKKTVLSVPQIAVGYDNSQAYVFVVDNKKVTQKNVTLGDQIDQNLEITSGLTAGDVIVTNGISKLHSGSSITISQSKSE